MRSRCIVLLLMMAACGGGAKKPIKTTYPDEPSRSGLSSGAEHGAQNKGDVTLSTNTGDDLSWLAPVYFEFDSAELTQSTRDMLVRLHGWLASHSKTMVTIEGHCDEQGTTEYNIGLGQRRAQAMTDYLVRLGVDRKRVSPISYGAERPAVDGHDEVAWSKNRRGEFHVDQ